MTANKEFFLWAALSVIAVAFVVIAITLSNKVAESVSSKAIITPAYSEKVTIKTGFNEPLHIRYTFDYERETLLWEIRGKAFMKGLLQELTHQEMMDKLDGFKQWFNPLTRKKEN